MKNGMDFWVCYQMKSIGKQVNKQVKKVAAPVGESPQASVSGRPAKKSRNSATKNASSSDTTKTVHVVSEAPTHTVPEKDVKFNVKKLQEENTEEYELVDEEAAVNPACEELEDDESGELGVIEQLPVDLDALVDCVSELKQWEEESSTKLVDVDMTLEGVQSSLTAVNNEVGALRTKCESINNLVRLGLSKVPVLVDTRLDTRMSEYRDILVQMQETVTSKVNELMVSQGETVKKVDELSTRMERVEDAYGYQINVLGQQLSGMIVRCDELQRQLDAAKSQNSALQTQLMMQQENIFKLLCKSATLDSGCGGHVHNNEGIEVDGDDGDVEDGEGDAGLFTQSLYDYFRMNPAMFDQSNGEEMDEVDGSERVQEVDTTGIEVERGAESGTEKVSISIGGGELDEGELEEVMSEPDLLDNPKNVVIENVTRHRSQPDFDIIA